jgi:hypothetical protein
MITVRLIGGLGNQMFQYAAGRRLALARGVPLRLDLGWYDDQPPQDTQRSYELGVYAADDVVTKASVPLPEAHTRLGLLRQRTVEALGRGPRVLRQRGTGFDAAILDAPDGSHLVGYWQSERFFADHAATIRADLTLRAPLGQDAAEALARIEDDRSAVSLHVRRGDYVSNPHANRFHGTMGVDYYQRAVDLIVQRTGGDVRLHVFSDDPDWCEQHLQLGHDMTVVRGNSGNEDLALMRACRHHVIANSSFSWWGAWLDGRPGGIVVAPERWAIDADSDFSAIYAEGWERR